MSRTLVVSLAAVLLAPAVASAHRMDVVAKVTEADPTTVYVEAGYEENEPAQEAKVTLTDTAGKVVAEGTTNDRGVVRLPRPAAGTYTVTVDDGAGHRTKVTLTVPDAAAPAPAAAQTAPPNKWLAIALGLGVIAGGAALARWLLRKPPQPLVGG